MPEPLNVEWETCNWDCLGVRLPSGGKCLAHADEQHLGTAMKRLSEEGSIDARGVTISSELLRQLLTAAPRLNGQPAFQDVRFDHATFDAHAEFGEVTFKGDAGFEWASFKGAADFARASFEQRVLFNRAIFERAAGFEWAKFKGATGFGWATFKGDVGFDEAVFGSGGGFGKVTFEHAVTFDRATFRSGAGFGEATFGGAVGFDRTTFRGEMWFGGATFEQARQIGPILGRRLVLDGAIFKQRVQIQISAQSFSCERARFPAGVQFQLRWARVALGDADFPAPSIVVGAWQQFKGLDERELVARWTDGPGGPPRPAGQPWVASLRHADVAGLAIANADLQACRFAGAHNLDRLRLETPKGFAAAPGPKAVATGWAWPPAWWWTRRQTLAEEHAWRAVHERGIRKAGWHTGESWPASADRWIPNPPRPAPDLARLERHVGQAVRDWRRLRRRIALAWRIAAARASEERTRRRQAISTRQQGARELANLYRALRKSREDAKDEPGAADFYYGEMEMRRHAAPRFSVERAVLTLYWLLAGYGLRAWRALAALAMVLVLAAWLFVHHHGLVNPGSMTFWSALRYSGRTAIGLLPKDQPALTPWGDVLQIAVRVVVPVLLGLAVLSIRGRVKR